MSRIHLSIALVALLALSDAALAQVPPTTPPPTGRGGRGGDSVTAAPQGGRRGGGGGGRGGGTAVMTLTTPAWTDGGMIPVRYTQAGADMSPALSWTGAPPGTASFVLIVHDADGSPNTIEGMLHWMVWNIPGTSNGLSIGFPQGPQANNGTRQISQSGPYYRGPAAPAIGAVHHYMFELFALDTVLTVEAVGASPAATRTAVLAAMAGRVRGKAIMFGLFRRPE